MSAAETAVAAANRAFYDAFKSRDLSTMNRLWATEHLVACIHPGWRALHGRDAVMSSWRAILGSAEAPDVECDEEAVIVLGSSAFVTCIERIGQAELIATNVFTLEADQWRLVHHQAAPVVQEQPPPAPDGPLN